MWTNIIVMVQYSVGGGEGLNVRSASFDGGTPVMEVQQWVESLGIPRNKITGVCITPDECPEEKAEPFGADKFLDEGSPHD